MAKTTEINKALQMMQARQEALQQRVQTTMKPIGKIGGSDAFTWYQAPTPALMNTLLNFPFPIVWITRQRDLAEMNDLLRKKTPDFKSILCYGERTFEMEELNEDLFEIHYLDDLNSALSHVVPLLDKNCVLLITGDEQDERHYQKLIEAFKEKNKK